MTGFRQWTGAVGAVCRVAALCIWGAGCASAPNWNVADSVVPYRPAVDVASLDLPFPEPEPAEAEPVVAVTVNSGGNDEDRTADETPVAAATEEPDAVEDNGGGSRPLRRGDRIAVSLHTYLGTETYQEQVDDRGVITLPFVGGVKVDTLTTAEAEDRIRTVFVDEQQIYKTLTVSIMAQAEEFFVMGKVNRPGKYATLTGDKTLLQAIAEAGGFDPFANPKKVQVIRKSTGAIEYYNAERIQAGKDEDPLILPGDQIIVPRKFV